MAAAAETKTLSFFEQASEDVMSIVLSFLWVSERMRVADTSHRNSDVFKNPRVWRVINIDMMPPDNFFPHIPVTDFRSRHVPDYKFTRVVHLDPTFASQYMPTDMELRILAHAPHLREFHNHGTRYKEIGSGSYTDKEFRKAVFPSLRRATLGFATLEFLERSHPECLRRTRELAINSIRNMELAAATAVSMKQLRHIMLMGSHNYTKRYLQATLPQEEWRIEGDFTCVHMYRITEQEEDEAEEEAEDEEEEDEEDELESSFSI